MASIEDIEEIVVSTLDLIPLEVQKGITITFNEESKGWTSFHSFKPSFMIGMNNKFFSFAKGNLHLHHAPDSDRNTFYGDLFTSKISTIVNESPSDIKVFKDISLEGNKPWSVLVKGYVDSIESFYFTTLEESQLVKKEGIYYSNLYRNESTTDLSSKASFGIGIVAAFIGTNGIDMGTELPASMSIGDTIYNVTSQLVGIVQNMVGSIIYLVAPPANVNTNDFIIGQKNSKSEGAAIRGYAMRVDLENGDTTKTELYAINTEVFKSFP